MLYAVGSEFVLLQYHTTCLSVGVSVLHAAIISHDTSQKRKVRNWYLPGAYYNDTTQNTISCYTSMDCSTAVLVTQMPYGTA